MAKREILINNLRNLILIITENSKKIEKLKTSLYLHKLFDYFTLCKRLDINNNGTMSYKFIPCKEENEYTFLLTDNDKLSVLNKMKSWSININIDNDGNIKNN